MRRAFAAAIGAALLLTTLPAVASAAPVVRFTHHSVSMSCDTQAGGGFLAAALNADDEFGDFADAEFWLDPAIPFEDSPTASGFSGSVDANEGDEVVLSSSFTALGPEGDELGEATLVGTMTRDGDPFQVPPPPKSNRHWASVITIQPLSGTITFSWLDQTVTAADCTGEIVDEDIHEAQPTSFVGNNAGVVLDCFWETGDATAGLFAIEDSFGFFADAFFETADTLAVGVFEFSGSIDADGASVTVNLADIETGSPSVATASAEFTPFGEPVTSVLVSGNGHIKAIEQALTPTGSVQFLPGGDFPIDAASCDAHTFENHVIGTLPSGPKPAPTPQNDTPDGAVALEVGDGLQAWTTGTVLEAEVQETTCPQGFGDRMGHTLWYTIEGTGDPITVTTAGSRFDTVIAAFTSDGTTFAEIACNDDETFEPIGSSFQGSITFDSVEGETYWIEVGGFMGAIDELADAGRLRLAVS